MKPVPRRAHAATALQTSGITQFLRAHGAGFFDNVPRNYSTAAKRTQDKGKRENHVLILIRSPHLTKVACLGPRRCATFCLFGLK